MNTIKKERTIKESLISRVFLLSFSYLDFVSDT